MPSEVSVVSSITAFGNTISSHPRGTGKTNQNSATETKVQPRSAAAPEAAMWVFEPHVAEANL